MKYITFTIPCYNSENYMRRCVDSLLVGGEDVEILIIDDGSSDRTGAIADEYEMLYPNIVKAVHKPNGGHGSGVNRGLELAHGLYYKVVDSDDWFDRDAYLKMLDKIKSFEIASEDAQIREAICENRIREENLSGSCVEIQQKEQEKFPDLIICNYVYDHLDEGIQKPMNYRNVFPTEKMCNWNTIGHFHPSQYLIMHALMFQTKVLRQSGVKLPEHTFYVDNLFSYQPLPYAKNLYYMDIVSLLPWKGRSVGQRESPDEAYRPADQRDRACCKKCGFKRSEKNVSKTGRLHDAQYFNHVVHFFNPSSSDQNRGGVPET